jgi:hypothetical protein
MNRDRSSAKAVLQGTEAVAAKNLKTNQQSFRYPATGFCTPIEYSLLYAMISRPDVYPETVVQDAIKNEDFSEYLVVKPQKPQSRQQDEEEICSYAQLSAMLALAAEMWPAPVETEPNSSDVINIPQTLCKTLIQCVIRHAQEHDLERESEVKELLQPLQRISLQKGRRGALVMALPMYIGLGTSLVMGGNPLPLWIGYAMSVKELAKQEGEDRSFQQLANTTNRMADVETTSLLSEKEED